MARSYTWNWIKKITTHYWSFEWKIRSVRWPKINKDRIQWILVSFWTNSRNNFKTKTPYNYSLFLHLAINNTKLMSTFLKYFPSSFFPFLQIAKTLKIVAVIPNFLMRFSDFVSLLTRTWKSTWGMPRCKTGFLP